MSELPKGWKLSTLAEVAKWGSGGTPTSGRSDYYGGDIPWAVIGDMNDSYIYNTEKLITRKGLASSSAKLVPIGAVLIAMYGSIGKLGIAGIPMTTNQAIAFALPNEEIVLQKFLFWFLRSQRDSLLWSGKGATQQNISQTVLKAWQIPLPSIAEQHQIVEVLEDHLSRLDAATNMLSASQQKLNSYHLQSVQYLLLGGGRTQAQPSEVLTPVGVDDSVVSRLPANWHWKRLGDIADVVGGITKDSKKQSDPAFVQVPYLRVANVQRGRLDLREVSMIRVAPQKAESLQLRKGDVLLNEGGDRNKLGRGWVWEEQVSNCIHQNHVFRARLRSESLDPVLLSWWANTLGGRWCETNGKQSVNLASISLNRIRLMPVPIPPTDQIELLREMVDALDASVMRLRAVLSSAQKQASNLRVSLLNAAFTGQLTREATHV